MPDYSSVRPVCLPAYVVLFAMLLMHIPANSNEFNIEISGAQRTLYEYLENPFRIGRTEDETLLSFRTNVHVKAQRGKWSFIGEMMDSRAYGIEDERNLNVASVNTIEPIQYYVHYQTPVNSAHIDEVGIKVGRFTTSLGSQRMIGRNAYRNTLFNFMGTQAYVSTVDGNRLDAFWMLAGQIRPSDPFDLEDNAIRHDRYSDDFWVGGLFAENITWLSDITTRAYVIWLDEQDSPGTRESLNRQLVTAGAQFIRAPAPGHGDFDVEGAMQRGTRRATNNPNDLLDLDVYAGFLHAEVGYSFTALPLNFAITYDFVTGDDSPTDQRSNVFDAYFGPIKGDLGPTGQFTLLHRNNLSAPGLRIKYDLGAGMKFMFHWQAVWLDSATDSFGRIGVRDINGTSGDFAGHQLHAGFKTPLPYDGWRLDIGAVHFDNGEFFESAPNATGNGNPLFLFTMLEYQF